MSRTSLRSNADLPPPSDRRVPRPSRDDRWNASADIEVFVFAVEAELEAMDRERIGVHRRGRKPDLTLRRRLIGLIWTLTFGGMQWRIAGWLSGVPFTTLHSAFARWSRLRLWRRLGQRLALDWRLARGDEVLPSAVVADSRSLRSAPTAWVRGIDGGKWVLGVKLFAVCDKHGPLLDLELQPVAMLKSSLPFGNFRRHSRRVRPATLPVSDGADPMEYVCFRLRVLAGLAVTGIWLGSMAAGSAQEPNFPLRWRDLEIGMDSNEAARRLRLKGFETTQTEMGYRTDDINAAVISAFRGGRRCPGERFT
jgi:transposase